MPSRPAIPAEITREILLESGHRCAVCGTPCPLERAHIIPWHKSGEHKAEDLICLCANCHERADKEKWGETTLREYKRRPWVLRQYMTSVDRVSEPITRLRITVDIELEHFDDKHQDWLRHAVAGFLDISPHAVRIAAIEGSSVEVIIELPVRSAARLLSAYRRNEPELVEYLAPLVLLDLDVEMARREEPPDQRLPSLKQPMEGIQVTKLDVLRALYIAYRAEPGEWVNSGQIRRKLGLSGDRMNAIILSLKERGFIEAKFLADRALLKITADGVSVLES